ncbi:MAG: hypothetical protein IJ411_03710 [Oscillospiraceae bacterium]|nr:hypothetical protein [Oscillospiraceae bacterium]
MKQWKRVLSLLLALCLMASCSAQPRETESAPTQESSPVETPKEPEQETPAEEAQPEYPVLEAADFSSITLAEVEGAEVRVSYPADQFTPAENFEPLTLYLNETIGSEQAANININKSSAFEAKLNQVFLDEMLAAQKNVEGAEALTINVAEVRSLNGEPVFYLENVTEINDAVLDLMIEEGILTEEAIEQAGGREVFKAIPPTKSVAIYGIVDGYLTMYTGTYYDDAHKQTMIDAMTILIANTEFVE